VQWLLCSLLLLAAAMHASADMRTFAEKYLAKLKIDEVPVLYSECLQPLGKALLVIGPDTRKALLIEVQGDDVVNLAEVAFRQGEAVVLETHGGLYTLERVGHLAGELARYPFALVRPDEVQGILRSRPGRSCDETGGP
jgi:hypothetical protein